MFVSALFDPLSIVVLVAIGAMTLVSFLWFRDGQKQSDELKGGLQVLRRLGLDLNPHHPIRKRLESAPVVDLSFEEVAKLMVGQPVEPAAHALIRMQDKIAWTERFSQYAIHLGILGTVFALVSSDPTDLESFRARLPLALGTTFWGLIGAMVLSTIAGWSETVLDGARHQVRHALLDALDDVTEAVAASHESDADAAALSPSDERTVVDLPETKVEEG